MMAEATGFSGRWSFFSSSSPTASVSPPPGHKTKQLKCIPGACMSYNRQKKMDTFYEISSIGFRGAV